MIDFFKTYTVPLWLLLAMAIGTYLLAMAFGGLPFALFIIGALVYIVYDIKKSRTLT